MARTVPLLIQRVLLLDQNRSQPDPARVAEVVAFQHAGHRVLLLARRPVRWRPTRSSMDADLGLQQTLHQAFVRAGAQLDGTLYLGTGFFARRQARIKELERLAQRYGVEAGDLTAIGSDPTLLETVVQSGGRAFNLGPQRVPGASQSDSLKAALDQLG